MKLKLKRESSNKKVLKALKKGKKVKAKVQVKYIDAAGNQLQLKTQPIELR